uniref:Uncharacterized protein n=1 Tax=Parascaris equorum TaxID=6256 RepID=A0A914RVH7_PAREQ
MNIKQIGIDLYSRIEFKDRSLYSTLITFTQYGYNSDFKLSACNIGPHEFDAETAAIEDIRRREILAQHGDRIRNIQRRFNLQS